MPHVRVPNADGGPAQWDYDSSYIPFPGKEMRGRMHLVTWTLMGSRRHHWMGRSGIRVSVTQLKLVMDLGNMFGALGLFGGHLLG